MNVRIPGDEAATLLYAVEDFITRAREAIQTRGGFYVALSGGSTPKKLFKLLATPQYKNRIDWNHVWTFWSDERSVPPSDPDSNYKMALDYCYPAFHSQMFRMVGETNIEEEALAYERLIQKIVPGTLFDLIMLGMGEDGHTASLFPGTAALQEQHRLVVANYVSQKATWRVTMTYRLINNCRQTIIYVIGDQKSAEVARALAPNADLPVAKVRNPLWILDRGAASRLNP